MDLKLTSEKPYIIRAFKDWIIDNECTPHLIVDMKFPETEYPDFVSKFLYEDQYLVLNVNPKASPTVNIENSFTTVVTRFQGKVANIRFPTEAIKAILNRDTEDQFDFSVQDYDEYSSQNKTSSDTNETENDGNKKGNHLKRVK